ncbi:MAG: laccase domain-containing protein [Clostridia bacterium]|nr:laccase domain-containing protein [Clostridia bacterium]
MFYFDGTVWKSTLLETGSVGHAFSTRLGGASALPHTASMNVGFGRGDDDKTVLRNMEILCDLARLPFGGLIVSPQFHTSVVRRVTASDAGDGIERENPSPSDGFVTDSPGVCFIVRTADCTPILLAGKTDAGRPVVGAAHAGWRGTVGLIAGELVKGAVSLGAAKESLRAAIGPCIGKCHFEVKEDFIESVSDIRGKDFASRHIEKRDGSYFADMVSMNVEILTSFGIARENIDVAGQCTVCDPVTYHSHRATGGVRGTMGSVIGIAE